MRASSNKLRWALALVVALVAVFVAPGAHAQTEASKTLFAEGRKLREDGKCAEAIDAFRRALDAWPGGLGSLRNIAECEEELGRYASARRSWWDLRREVLLAKNPTYDGWDTHAAAAHERLDPLTPRLTIELVGAAPDEVTVSINGDKLAATLVNVALERDVGSHSVEVRHADEVLASKTVLLDVRQTEVIRLRVTLPEKIETPRPTPGEPVRPLPAEPIDPFVIGGGVAVGVGALAFGGAIVAAVIRGSAISDLEDNCPEAQAGVPSPRCGPIVQDPVDTGRAATTAFNVLGIIGIVGVVGGITLFVVSATTGDAEETPPSGDAKPTESARVDLVPLPGGAALSLSGSF